VTRPARSGLGPAVALAVVSGAGLLAASSGAWATSVLQRPAPLPAQRAVLTAGELAPGARALGLVVLAAAAALLAARGRARSAVGVVLLLCALGAAVLSARAALDPAAAAPSGQPASLTATARPALATLAGLVGVAAGALVVTRGHRWPALGRRYETPAARAEAQPAGAPVEGAGAWDALDRGEDPTQERPVEQPQAQVRTAAGSPPADGDAAARTLPGTGDAPGPPGRTAP
jgi:hypothetical protein